MVFIRYWWIKKGQKPIEMAGHFSDERWKSFCAKPHPMHNDVTVLKISETPSKTWIPSHDYPKPV